MKGIVLTGVGFVVGLGEALLYYNLGQAQGKAFAFKIPPTKELMKTAGVVLMTSLVTTALFKGIEMAIEQDQKQLSKI